MSVDSHHLIAAEVAVRRNAARACTALVLGAIVMAGTARALPPEERDWDLQLSMYGWLASVKAEIEAGDVQTDVDMKFRDILGDLGWAMMGGVEGRYKRALMLVDVLGMQVVTDVTGNPRTRDFGLNGSLTVGGFDVHSRLTQWMLDVKPGFRVLSLPMADLTGGTETPEDRRRLDLDLFLGFRYWNVTTKTGVEIDPASLVVAGVEVPLPGNLPDINGDGVHLPGTFLNGTDKATQNTVDWFDPIVGARVTADVTRRWSVFLSGDVGGFNIGDDASTLTWQAMLGSHIELSEHWSLTTGYRALYIDRDDGLVETTLHGPQIGALFRF